MTTIKTKKPRRTVVSKNQLSVIKNSAPSTLEVLQKELSNLKEITETPYKTSGKLNQSWRMKLFILMAQKH